MQIVDLPCFRPATPPSTQAVGSHPRRSPVHRIAVRHAGLHCKWLYHSYRQVLRSAFPHFHLLISGNGKPLNDI